MIKYLYKSLRTPSLQELGDFKRGVWVHVVSPSVEELEHLADKFKLELSILQDALDEDEVPRLEREEGTSYTFVRFAYKDKSGGAQTCSLLLVFGKEFVMTVSSKALPAYDFLKTGRLAFATTQRAKLALLILSHVSDQYDLYINQTNRKIKNIRSRMRTQGITNQDFIDFATIQDELNEFLASLQPYNATLRRLLAGRHIPLYEEDHDLVEDITLSNDQSIEACQSNLRSIENIRDAYAAISANNLNRTIMILTIATILVALPNVFFGMYGMNVALPYQHKSWAFAAIVGGTTGLIALIVALFSLARRKRIL